MKLTAMRVLESPPKYLKFLEHTRWEDCKDERVGLWRMKNTQNVMLGIDRLAQAEESKFPYMYGALWLRLFVPHRGVSPRDVLELTRQLAWTPDMEELSIERMAELAEVREYGLASLRVITTAGVNYLVDAFQGIQNISLLRYHGIGTGTNAEATSDTALQTELTTQLSTASTRATGTLTEGASPNIFRTVGSNQVNTTLTVTEHGIFNQAATGGGTLWDRSVFAGVGLVNGNTFQTTYDMTAAAGG